MDQPAKPKLKLLIAGGCHVFGYPVGREYSFSTVAERRLAELATVQVDRVRASLQRYGVILDSLEGQPADVVVLQLGNFECPVSVSNHFRRFMGWKSEGASVISARENTTRTFSQAPKHRLRVTARSFYDFAVTALGRPLYQPEPFRAQFSAVLDAIAATGVGKVIAISPTPTANNMYMRYRLRGAEVVREEAESRGMLYLDSAAALGGPRASQDPDLHSHWMHLGREGQRLLGEALAELVKTRVLSGGQGPEFDARSVGQN